MTFHILEEACLNSKKFLRLSKEDRFGLLKVD